VVSSYFVPAVVGVAVATFAVWAVWGPEPRMTYALVNAVAVLIIDCPCALGLATPMSIMVGMGKGASEGVLHPERGSARGTRKDRYLVVDKTGTLTEGKPRLTSVAAEQGIDESDLLRFAASVERYSEHPLAAAIVRGAEETPARFEAGRRLSIGHWEGVMAKVEGHEVMVGNEALMKERGIGTGIGTKAAGAMFVAITAALPVSSVCRTR